MGVCLCKSKTTDDLTDNLSQSGRHSTDYGRTYAHHNERCDETLSETVDRLVKETLKVIGSVADSDPEPPNVSVSQSLLNFYHFFFGKKAFLTFFIFIFSQ